MLTTVVHDCSQVQRHQRARYLPFILAVSILITAGGGQAASVSVAPASVSLTASQSQQFTATVAGTANTIVKWSLSAASNSGRGLISPTGQHLAPASIASALTVTVTATSAADPTKTASATVTLTPATAPPPSPVTVSLTPSTASLPVSQNQQFTATVTGAANTGVSWSVSPAMGTISGSGLYSAPAALGSPQTVTVTATSVADATKKATASVSVVPPVQVTASPSTASLAPSGTQQFTAAVARTEEGR